MAEARANPPPLGGYDDHFVDAVDDDCHCVICQLPLKQPILTKCGHRFCTQCLDGHFERLERDRQPLNCPVDREKLSRDKADIFPDKATERKILSIFIKCPNEGCQWSGELRSKENHLASCPLQVVSCTNDNCNVRLPRKDLQAHVTSTCEWRVLHCSHCDVSHEACKTKIHQSECKGLPLKCPNKCEAIVAREEISTHIDSDCPLTITSCSYAEMGRGEKVQRKKVESHLQSASNLHLDLACAELNETRIPLINIQSQLNDTQFQLSNTQQESKENKRKLEEVNARESPSLLQISGVRTWKICGFMEKMMQAKRGKQTKIESLPFYDHRYKFGLILQIHDNKCRGSTNVYVNCFLMRGKYDAVLSWPFPPKKVTFTLIDQQEDPRQKKNKVVFFTSDDPLFDYWFKRRLENDVPQNFLGLLFIEEDDLNKRCYVVDDTIYIQIQIDKP